MNKVSISAPAKINLGLDVLSRLPNGYHNVRMLNTSLALSDTLEAERSDQTSLAIDVPGLSAGEDNLIRKALRRMETEVKKSLPLRMTLTKRIPMAAGLAGGSTDAAAAMIAANTLYSLSFSMEDLMRLGKEIGADVPYCLLNQTALAEGIGERLTVLAPLPAFPIVLVKPKEAVSTREIFEALVLDETTEHPDIDGMLSCLQSGNYLSLGKYRGNILETVTVKKLPVIRDLIRELNDLGSFCAGMSGSGPTVFALFDTDAAAETAFTEIRQHPAANGGAFLSRIIK